jgi:hypothetical protein
MSFLRHREIYRPMWSFRGRNLGATTAAAPTHRLDEFPAGYSLASCAPAEPASASPAGNQYAVQSFCRSRIFQRTANSVLTVCVSRGGKRKFHLADYQQSAPTRLPDRNRTGADQHAGVGGKAHSEQPRREAGGFTDESPESGSTQEQAGCDYRRCGATRAGMRCGCPRDG